MNISDDLNDLDPANYIRDIAAGALHLRRRVQVGILGATGSVGQRLITLLYKHPWFTITALAASERSTGKTYQEAADWRMNEQLPLAIGQMQLLEAKPDLPCDIVFSALCGQAACDIETEFEKAGYPVISCARCHRMDPGVPLLVPEVNLEHLELVKGKKGMIICKPNCAVIGLVIALRPLQLEFGIEAINVVTLQAISGAGFPGVPSLSLLDNVIPYIANEEERIEIEPHKVLGTYNNGEIIPYEMKISASCTRVPVTDGHLEMVSIKFKEKPSKKEIIRAWKEFCPPIQEYGLHSTCKQLIHYFEEDEFPQPRLHRDLEHGMAVSTGRLRDCSVLDYKFAVLSHNTVRGAAGGAILIAELLIKQGYLFW